MRVRILDPSKRGDVRKFIQLPFDLYKNCKNWCPPFRSELKNLMNKTKFPLYQHSEADFILAEDKGEVLGRIAIHHPKPYSKFKGKEVAFFNYFDVVQDAKVSKQLFDTALEWCSRRKINLVKGPTSFTRSGGKGLMIEGFEYKAPMGVNYNFPYYGKFIEAAGFKKRVDYVSGILDTAKNDIDPRVHIIAEKLQKRGKFKVVNFDSKEEMRRYIPDIYRINIEAFEDAPEFVPYTLEEFTAMAEDLLSVLVPGLPKIIKAGDEVIGFVIAYPDLGDGLRKAKGRMFPFGWIHLLNAKRTTTNLIFNGIGIIPKYQGSGANAVLYSELNKIRTDYPRFKTADNLQVADYNFRSFKDMSSVGTKWCITHRVYEKVLS